MKTRYFVDDASGRNMGECLVESPANPDGCLIVESERLEGNPLDYVWNGHSFTFSPPPGPPLADLKTKAKADIDAAAGAARARYITVTPGQEATYLLKSRQAREYQAAGYDGPVPPLVAAEQAAAGAPTPQAAAERILAEEAAWIAKAAQIEQARRAGKIAVEGAADAESVRQAADAALAALQAA